MKKIAFQLAVILAITLMACKKDKLEESVPGSDHPNFFVIYGDLSKTLEYTINGNSLQPFAFGYASARFHTDTDTISLRVDSVMLNGVPLKTYGGSAYYTTGSSTLPSKVASNWSVRGNNGMPDFLFDNNKGMPVYSGYAILPDSIDITKDLVIPVTGLSNMSTVIFTLEDRIGHSFMKYVDYAVTEAPASVSFTAAELSTLVESGYSQITISSSNFNISQLSGKHFQFQNTSTFYKKIVLH